MKKELKEAREQIQNFQEQLDNIKAQDDYKSNYIQELVAQAAERASACEKEIPNAQSTLIENPEDQ